MTKKAKKKRSERDSLHVTDVLVIGTGIAGLSCALKLSDLGLTVTLVCKASPDEGATRYAQGGIASVWSDSDSFEEHIQDTLLAGAGLCHREMAEICVREGPARVRDLIELGVKFTTKKLTPDFDLHIEGGHGKRRILHAADLTGWEIERALLEEVSKRKIKILDHSIAIDLVTRDKLDSKFQGKKTGQNRSLGAYVLDTKTGRVLTVAAKHTILATGGAGKVYLYTSNPDTATGDGIAMAYRAGAKIANMEFMQFHPTCLFHPEAKTFLITEALRGEGAVLRNLAGTAFMRSYHPKKDLAPRDIVARAIDLEMKRSGDRHVWLDTVHAAKKHGAKRLRQMFPNISATCLKFGIDVTKQMIPVVPAAHYTCGGVLVDVDGKTSIDGLYALGEVSCTGLHGANRLASNSLLEAVVVAHRTAKSIGSETFRTNQSTKNTKIPLPDWDPGQAVKLEEQINIAANWLELRQLMWNYVGIVRTDQRIERARRRIDLLKEEVNSYYWKYLLTQDLIELRNLLTVAELITRCAARRKESRGLHFNTDYPKIDDVHFKRDTII